MKYWASTFKEAFCDHFDCPLDSYDQEALLRFCYPHALPFALLWHPIKAPLFRGSISMLQRTGQARNTQELLATIDEFHDYLRLRSSFSERTLRIRVSGHRLMLALPSLFQELSVGSAA